MSGTPATLIVIAITVLLIILLGANEWRARKREKASKDAGVVSRPVTDPRQAIWILGFLLGLSLLGGAVLGYLVYDLREDLDASSDRIDQQVTDAEMEVAEVVDAALLQVKDLDQLRADLDDLSGNLDTLERNLFGFPGAPVGAMDVLGDLDFEIDDLRACVNRLITNLSLDLFLLRCF